MFGDQDAHQEAPLPARVSRAAVWTAVFVPAAAVSVFEIAAATLTAHGPDRVYAMRCAALVALGVMAAAAAAGLAAAGARFVSTRRAAASLAAGLSVFLGLLFVMGNGLPPLTDGAPRTGTTSIVVLAAISALAAALVRRALPLPSPESLAPFLEPPLLAAALVGGYAVTTRLRILPGSRLGLALEGVAVLLAVSDAALIAFLTRRMQGARPVFPVASSRSGAHPVPVGAARLAPDAPAPRGFAGPLVGAGIYPLLTILAFGLGRSPFCAVPALRAAARPDVLLLVLDTTREDAAPAPMEFPFPTISVEALAEGGTRFTSAFSTSCWTLPAHGSLFTGLAPSEHGASWATEHLSPSVVTLAERFRRAGFRTAAFSANPWITPEFGFGRGFERFVIGDADRRPLKPWLLALGAPRGPWNAAASLFEDAGGLALASEALRFLGEHDDPRPAFVFLNLLEPHLPYDPPRAALGSLGALAETGWDMRSLRTIDQDRLRDLLPGATRTPTEREGLRLLYGAEIAYDDDLIGRIAGRLADAGRLDATIVALTADHGENLGDHPPLDHQLGLWDSLLHVPLILRYPPRVKAGAVDDALVSLVDVPAALLSLAGASKDGGPLLGEGRRDAVFFEYDRPAHILGLIRDRLKIDPAPWERDLTGIRTRDAKWIDATDGRAEAYDLAADPREHRNLAAGGAAPPAMEALARRLHEAIAARSSRPPDFTSSAASPAPAPPMSDEAAEKLRSLGYIR